MTQQLNVMLTQSFYSLSTGTVVVDMALFNANINALVYIVLEFVVAPSGQVLVQEKVNAFSLLEIEESPSQGNVAEKVIALGSNFFKVDFAFFIIYMCMVGFFVLRMTKELKDDAHRKFLNEQKGFAVSAFEFFFHDPFHILDA